METVMDSVAAEQDRFKCLRPAELSLHEKKSLVKLAGEVLASRHRRGAIINSPKATAEYLRLLVAERHEEVFGALFLDRRLRLIESKELFHGTVHAAAVHPRVVVRQALECNAVGMVIYHNHPSGDPTPSEADKELTRLLRHALELVDVYLLDHIVVGAEGWFSFAEHSMLE